MEGPFPVCFLLWSLYLLLEKQGIISWTLICDLSLHVKQVFLLQKIVIFGIRSRAKYVDGEGELSSI